MTKKAWIINIAFQKMVNLGYSAEVWTCGTVSLLAEINLQTGETIPLVQDKHSSKEYMEFLKLLDIKYPQKDKMRLVLDNLKVHSSEETRKYKGYSCKNKRGTCHLSLEIQVGRD